MTTKDQLIACAELDGWKMVVRNLYLGTDYRKPYSIKCWRKGNKFKWELPNYDSLDVLIPAIRRWCNKHGWSSYCHYLRLSTIIDWQICAEILSKEPAQLREAWLRAAGKGEK